MLPTVKLAIAVAPGLNKVIQGVNWRKGALVGADSALQEVS
jgi:hypothetical protein